MKKIHPTAIVILTSVIFLVLIIVLPSISKFFYEEAPPKYFYGIYAAMLLFVSSTPGIYFILSKRAPTMGRISVIEGKSAVTSGIIWFSMLAIPATVILVKSIIELVEH